jgi:asparagine synthase (glutamine-hydrolysing)
MCGISAILSTSKIVRNDFVSVAIDSMDHRGPDSNGSWTDDKRISLGHNRLAILDLSDAGHQPMMSSCGNFILSFNGEIYNHLELREQYLSKHSFRSNSDSETILELFRVLGIAMQHELIGMWAILIWDIREQQLFVSRDRFGQKPLYYLQQEDSIAFASEIKPLLNLLKEPEDDATMISEYLATGNYGHLREKTFFNQIKQVRPSHFAMVKSQNVKFTSTAYWELPVLSEKSGCKATPDYLSELKAIIEEAVLSQTLADVPIGVTLSGGIDSSVIVGILAKHYPDKFAVFTAQTPGSKYDESKYVKAVLDRLSEKQFELFSTDLNNLMSLDDLDRLLKIQEEPFGDPSIMAHFQLMQLAKENNTKVILGGQGADEIFLGYGHSVNVILAHCIRHLKVKTILVWLKKGELGYNLWLRIILAALFPSLEMKLRQRSRVARKKRLAADSLTKSNDIKLHRLVDVNQSWEDSIRGVHIPHLVHYDDRNGMSQSIEGRMPFMDQRIIEKLGELKPSEFVKGGKRKNILRLACKEYLPEEVFNRRDKIGFYTPILAIISGWNKEKKLSIKTKEELAHFNKSPTVMQALKSFRRISLHRWMQIFDLKDVTT